MIRIQSICLCIAFCISFYRLALDMCLNLISNMFVIITNEGKTDFSIPHKAFSYGRCMMMLDGPDRYNVV